MDDGAAAGRRQAGKTRDHKRAPIGLACTTKNPAQAPGLSFQAAWSAEPSIVHGFLDRVLHAADGVLHFARGLLRLAFAFELGVAGRLAGHFLDLAFALLERAFDAILVHVGSSRCFEITESMIGRRERSRARCLPRP